MGKYGEFLSKGIEYVVAGQRTGQSVMNAFRDVVEEWTPTDLGNVRTASGNILPDVWEISGDDWRLDKWFVEAERVLRELS